jgi:predicted RNase H-like HicB family nuclease
MADPSTQQGVVRLTVEVEREEDGRWLAVVPELPGVMAYGATERDAVDHAKAVALTEIGVRIEERDPLPGIEPGEPLRDVTFTGPETRAA